MIVVQLFLAVAVCALFIRFINGNKRLPPGPLRLPVLGSAIQLYLSHPTVPHLALSNLAAKYGEIFSFGFGSQLAVAVSSYEALREIFRLDDTNRRRYLVPFVEDRNYGKNLGIFFGVGRNWLDVRIFTKKIMRKFGYGNVKIMDQSLIDSANQLIDSIKTLLLDNNDGTFAVKTSIFSVHVLNVLWTTVGGYKFDPNDELLIRNMNCLDKAAHVYGNQNLYNVFPFLKSWFPSLVNYPEHLKIHEEIHGFTKFLVNDAKERRSQRLDSEPTSFIEIFLDKIDEHHGNPDTIYTEEQLEIILEDLLFGGLETTGTLLNWSILYMVLNPDIQNKVRQVIQSKRTNQTLLMPAVELKRIPYVKATILEIFRCGNVAPTPVPRLATGDIQYRDYILPKGTLLFYNLEPIFSDKKFWKDPETFQPERFLNENGEINQSASEKISGTVFGVGARTCFGENVGLDSLYTYFAALIVNFKFDVIPGQEPSADNYTSNFTKYPNTYSVKVTKLSA
ncbi:cytochrome P450 2J6-like [Bradysia coprophila]|uniref:cytochrome P450 2J6-like n=1 Tax=Bradysia coprophila TaxID=38358 RepID=UPI00187D9FBB|nr:cytochrome P450 2J6-like [Bradysia coprophila]